MKNEGFTLVELLGVIVVLAIIALIAVPAILGIIEKSRKGSLQNSGYGLVEAGTLYNAQYQNEQTARFDMKDNEVTSEEENKLTYKGNIKEGTVLVNNNGEVTVCINDGRYAAYKNFKDSKVTIVDNKTCNIPENSNIVYLDNEATVDVNIESLLQRIESLEDTVSKQNKKIEELETTKSNQAEITNQMANLTNTHNTDITLLNNKLGSTNISSIGNGTITGAIESLNNQKFRRFWGEANLYTAGTTLTFYEPLDNFICFYGKESTTGPWLTGCGITTTNARIYLSPTIYIDYTYSTSSNQMSIKTSKNIYNVSIWTTN